MASILENWRQKIKIGDFFGSNIFGARATPDFTGQKKKFGPALGWPSFQALLTISVHLKSVMIRGVTFDVSALIRSGLLYLIKSVFSVKHAALNSNRKV